MFQKEYPVLTIPSASSTNSLKGFFFELSTSLSPSRSAFSTCSRLMLPPLGSNALEAHSQSALQLNERRYASRRFRMMITNQLTTCSSFSARGNSTCARTQSKRIVLIASCVFHYLCTIIIFEALSIRAASQFKQRPYRSTRRHRLI